MKKTFDCVELQHRGAEKLQAKLSQMTLDEQVAYWERRGKELRERKKNLSTRRKAS
jgi:hypothetical protein